MDEITREELVRLICNGPIMKTKTLTSRQARKGTMVIIAVGPRKREGWPSSDIETGIQKNLAYLTGKVNQRSINVVDRRRIDGTSYTYLEERLKGMRKNKSQHHGQGWSKR